MGYSLPCHTQSMANCTVTLKIANYDKLLEFFRLFGDRDSIISLFDGTPLLNEEGLTLTIYGGLGCTIANALYPAREDLIVKHKIKFTGTKAFFESRVLSTTDDAKNLIDAVAAHNCGIQIDIQFLRWIPAFGIRSNTEILLNYCFEKGYLTGINEGLINTIDHHQLSNHIEKFLDAGADPTKFHCGRTDQTAISNAFRCRNKDAIRVFMERGYNLSAEIAKISHADYHLYGILPSPIKKMINGILYTLSGDKKTATAVQLTETEGLVVTQLAVMELADKTYLFVDQPTGKTVFGERIPVSEFAV